MSKPKSKSSVRGPNPPVTIPFENFWAWLMAHSNCIVRAGTPEAMLFDHEDYHWHLAAEDEQTLIVQLVRGKELVGELVVFAAEIAYVASEALEGEEEFVFECIIETESIREVAYQFVLVHEYEEAAHAQSRRWTH